MCPAKRVDAPPLSLACSPRVAAPLSPSAQPSRQTAGNRPPAAKGAHPVITRWQRALSSWLEKWSLPICFLCLTVVNYLMGCLDMAGWMFMYFLFSLYVVGLIM